MNVLGFTRCGDPPCTCFPERGLAACSPGLGPPFTRVPTFTHREAANITRISLSGNALEAIAPGDLARERLPNLRTVDLRLNPKLDCSTLRNIPMEVTVITDCAPDDTEGDLGTGSAGYPMETEPEYQADDLGDDPSLEEGDKLQAEADGAYPDGERQTDDLLDVQSNSQADDALGPGNSNSQDADRLIDSYSVPPADSEENANLGSYELLPRITSHQGTGMTSNRKDRQKARMTGLLEVLKTGFANRKWPMRSSDGRPKKVIIEFKGVMKVLFP